MTATPASALRILHRDEHVLAVDKPAGMLTVPGRGAAESETPLSALVRELTRFALPVHRLDRGTSGIVVFALSREAHRFLNAVFEGRRAEKIYLALVRADLARATRCEFALAETRKGRMRVADRPRDELAQASRTDFRPLERFGNFTWALAQPRTGRMHQIRVHLAALGHPLAVDPRYGEERPLRRGELHPDCEAPEGIALARTPLHSSALRLPHPSGRGWLQVEAPLPKDLATCLDLLRAARRSGPA